MANSKSTKSRALNASQAAGAEGRAMTRRKRTGPICRAIGDLSVTTLAARLGKLALADESTGCVDAAHARNSELAALEELIMLKPATTLEEVAIQMALVSQELAGDWSSTPGDAVNEEMRKLARLVTSAYNVIERHTAADVAEEILGGWCGRPEASFPPA